MEINGMDPLQDPYAVPPESIQLVESPEEQIPNQSDQSQNTGPSAVSSPEETGRGATIDTYA
jgi:hypothetical protein